MVHFGCFFGKGDGNLCIVFADAGDSVDREVFANIVPIWLQNVRTRTMDAVGNSLDVFWGKLGYECCSEMMVNASSDELRYACVDGGLIHGDAADCVILVGWCLDVHGHVVEQVFAQQGREYLGVRTVGIQFYEISKGSHFGHESGETRLERGFAAADYDGVEEAMPFLEPGKHFLLGRGANRIVFDELAVVAVRTP